MNKNKLLIFYFSPVLIFFANEVFMSYIRPIYGLRKYGLLSTILGWLPNYFAAFGFILLGLILFKFIIDINKNKNYYSYIYKYMSLISFISLTGLIWWEFEQKNGKLIYDINDIYATIGGVLCGYLIFLILKFKNLLEPKDIVTNKVD